LAQPEKAEGWMDVTPVDIVTDTNDEQPENAFVSTTTTLPGMEIDTKDVQ